MSCDMKAAAIHPTFRRHTVGFDSKLCHVYQVGIVKWTVSTYVIAAIISHLSVIHLCR